ncbi:MAG TPA: DUF3987 domain-containing protein [Casimicrobiaceae bacterium]
MAKLSNAPLSGKALADLAKSGYTLDDIEKCGIYPVVTEGDDYQIPYFDPDAKQPDGFWRVKHFSGPNKYTQPDGVKPRAYFSRLLPRKWLPILKNSDVSLLITEGEKKADCACKLDFPTIGLGGVDCWATDSGKAIDDLYRVDWKDRVAFIVYDSDSDRNDRVREAREALRAWLWAQGAIVYFVDLPSIQKDGSKTGLDDFLVAKGSDALTALLDAVWDKPLDPPHDLFAAPEIAPPLKRGLLPKTLDAFAFDSPSTIDPTPMGYATLAVCAMAASDRVKVRIVGNWYERPCLWVILFGESGAGKSPVIRPAASPLEAIAAERDDLYHARREAWLAKKDAPKKKDEAPPPEPKPEPRLITHDATSAAVSELLKVEKYNGIGIVNDEISTVFASLDNSRDSKGAAERGPMLKLYDGGPYWMHRAVRGEVGTHNWSASLLGGVTTDRLSLLAKVSVADGMLARCMLVQTQKLPPTTALGTNDSTAYIAYKDLVRRLVALRPLADVVVNLTPEAERRLGEAKQKWQAYALDIAAELPRYAERLSKATGQAARIALLLMMIDACEKPTRTVKHGNPGEKIAEWRDVSEDDMERAIALLELQMEHDRVFYRALKGYEVGESVILAREVARWILRDNVAKFSQKDITHSLGAWRGNVGDRTKRDALSILTELNWIAANRRDWYDYSGRIAQGTLFGVNPTVHSVFRAQAEGARREAAALRGQMEVGFERRRREKLLELPPAFGSKRTEQK